MMMYFIKEFSFNKIFGIILEDFCYLCDTVCFFQVNHNIFVNLKTLTFQQEMSQKLVFPK